MAVELGSYGIWSRAVMWQRLPGDELASAAAEVERLGYGTTWFGMADGDLRLPEAMLDATSRLTVATGIVSIWHHEARAVAESFARVTARHSADRLLIGLGNSHAPLVGADYSKPVARTIAYLDELDALEPTIPPAHRTLAALGPRMLGISADRTRGAHPYLVTPEYTRQARETLGAKALLAPEQGVVLSADPGTARRIAREGLALYLTLPNYTNNFLRAGFTPDDLADGGSDRLIDALFAWGTDEQIAARLREHLDAGADHVCAQVLTDTPDDLPREEWRRLAAALSL